MTDVNQYNPSPTLRVSGKDGEVRHDETDQYGNKKVTQATAMPGANYELDAQGTAFIPRASGYISTATTTTIDTGAGRVYLNYVGGTNGNVTVYDNTAASGAILLPATTPAGQIVLNGDAYSTGVTIVTAAATVLKWYVL